MSESLIKLRELTYKLRTGPISRDKAVDDWIEWKVAKGIGFGQLCYEGPDATIYHSRFSAGSEFPRHDHGADEWLIVTRGKLILHTDDQEIEVKSKEYFHLSAHSPHSTTFTEDTDVIALWLMPEESNYDAI